MKLLIDIKIPGIPVPKARPRVTRNGTYDSQSEIKRGVQWEIKKRLPAEYQVSDKALVWTVDAYFPRPNGHYGTGKNSDRVKPSAPQYHRVKPDHDNIQKFYLDCMNKIVFVDDSQVVGIRDCAKYWINKNQQGYVRIRIYEL